MGPIASASARAPTGQLFRVLSSSSSPMTLGSLPSKCFDREWSDCLQDTQHVFFFFKRTLFSPRVEVRDPPEGDRQGRTSVHSCLYSGFLGSPPGKVRRGRGIVSFLGGPSPSSQRKRKTGLEGLAQCPPTVVPGAYQMKGVGAWVRPCCSQGFTPAPSSKKAGFLLLSSSCQVLGPGLVEWLVLGELVVQCSSHGQKARKVWMCLWTHLWQAFAPCLTLSPVESWEGTFGG